jgi:hypothetical protein
MAEVIGSVTAAGLYGRMRALVDLGLIEFVEGRGPGSGTPLDGSGVAALVIALLAADTLQDTDDRVRGLCLAAPKGGDRCPWTGAANLQEALAAVLMSAEMSEKLIFFSIYRSDSAAAFGYGRPVLRSDFVSGAPRPISAISIIASIETGAIRMLGELLRAELANQRREEGK